LEERKHFKLFPDEDVGVAQGSALSALAANIALRSFDERMNEIVCVRYIHDFIMSASRAKLGALRIRCPSSQRLPRKGPFPNWMTIWATWRQPPDSKAIDFLSKLPPPLGPPQLFVRYGSTRSNESPKRRTREATSFTYD
jgi:hypothetical protein